MTESAFCGKSSACRERLTPKPYHHGDLYETLVNAGTELLKDKGLEHFTLRECARRAGVSHAAPKNHFASVEDLLCEIAARGFEQFVDRTRCDGRCGSIAIAR